MIGLLTNNLSWKCQIEPETFYIQSGSSNTVHVLHEYSTSSHSGKKLYNTLEMGRQNSASITEIMLGNWTMKWTNSEGHGFLFLLITLKEHCQAVSDYNCVSFSFDTVCPPVTDQYQSTSLYAYSDWCDLWSFLLTGTDISWVCFGWFCCWGCFSALGLNFLMHSTGLMVGTQEGKGSWTPLVHQRSG